MFENEDAEAGEPKETDVAAAIDGVHNMHCD